MKLLSWNVNGYRAILKKGFGDFLKKEKPDILGLQETKVSLDQLDENSCKFEGYFCEFNPAERKGYSGTAVFFKKKPLNIKKGFGIKKFDIEGRFIELEYSNFYFITVYCPNGGMGPERLQYKLDFYEAFLEYIENLKKNNKPVIICGDINTAHNEIDLARPKENENNTGFLRIERDWMDKLEAKGWVDTFRYLYPQKVAYTWWDYKTRARERNIGWRIDYFYINKEYLKIIKDSFMLENVQGSDHCPVGVNVEINY